jgi:hypothetical protein
MTVAFALLSLVLWRAVGGSGSDMDSGSGSLLGSINRGSGDISGAVRPLESKRKSYSTFAQQDET